MKKVLSLAMVMVLVLTTNVSFAASVNSNEQSVKQKNSMPIHEKYITFETNDLVELPFNYSSEIHIQKTPEQIAAANRVNEDRVVCLY